MYLLVVRVSVNSIICHCHLYKRCCLASIAFLYRLWGESILLVIQLRAPYKLQRHFPGKPGIAAVGQSRSWHKPPPYAAGCRVFTNQNFNHLATLKTPVIFVNQLALAGIASFAFATLMPQSMLAAPTLTLKASFDGAGNGRNPYTALTPVGNGKFYGTTTEGGPNDLGTIFEFDPSGGLTLKASFAGSGNPRYPSSALTAIGNGKFYGLAVGDGTGPNENANVFEFDPTSGGITLKGLFDRPVNGGNPSSELTPAGNGNFYGTTYAGGPNEDGTIYEFDPNSGSIILKIGFDGAGNGRQPLSAMQAAANGKFYGTTGAGGANNFGTIFEFDPTTGGINIKVNFDGAGNSSYPSASLTLADNGIFYGTTSRGGTDDFGTIFDFDPSSGGITLRASFDGPGNGSIPNAPLTPAGNGKFYGTTRRGGANDHGTIFEFDPTSGAIIPKASFDGSGNGMWPLAALTPAGNGKLYGTTFLGGANDLGGIFEFSDLDPTSVNPVPGPLPLLDMAAAYGWSRKLRRRIQQSPLTEL